MRKSKLSATETHALEIEADDRRRTRATGFAKMHERDAAWRRLSNDVIILWHVGKELEDGVPREYIPDGSFALIIEGKKYVFDTDEFRQSLRWA